MEVELICSSHSWKENESILSKTHVGWLAFLQLKQLSVDFSPGSVLWFVGWLVNVHSDHILRSLRKPGETGYKIPTGKGLNHISYFSPFPTTVNISCTRFTIHLTFNEENLGSRRKEILHYWRGLVFREFWTFNSGVLLLTCFILWSSLSCGLEFVCLFCHWWGVTRKSRKQ